MIKGKGKFKNKKYQENVLGLMEMLQDMGNTVHTRFGNKKETEIALKKIYSKKKVKK